MTLYAELDGNLALSGKSNASDFRQAGTRGGPTHHRAPHNRAPGRASRNSVRNAQNAFSWKLKAIADYFIAFVLLVTFAPILIGIAVAVKFSSPGPIFFRQPRYGAGKSIVVVTKFRTMRVEGTDMTGRRQATRDDDRITPVGGFLRKTCLDELPQLWDVLCGKMSLVGPRPHALVLEIDGEDIEDMIPEYHERHTIRPGMTGLAQINGNRGPVHTRSMAEERIQFDLDYIQTHSLLLDAKILLKTLVVPFQKEGSF